MPSSGHSRSLPTTLRRHISNISEHISRKMPRIREKKWIPERFRLRRKPPPEAVFKIAGTGTSTHQGYQLPTTKVTPGI